MTLSDKWKQFAADPRAQKAGAFYKKAETGVWRALDPIGRGANKLAGRAGAESFWPTELGEGELDKAARILRTFTLDGVQADDAPGADETGGVAGGIQKTQADKDKYADRKTQKVIKKIPPSALKGAAGIAIFTCFRTGFGFSGSGGSGVVMARMPDGSWSPPSGVLVHTIGWGFLIGLDIYDVVLILRSANALKAFEHPKVSIGGELSIAAGPVGNGTTLDSGVEAAPCWSYTKSKGAYAGLQLDGTIVLKRDDANSRFYGETVTVPEVFAGRVMAPKAVHPLWQTLYAAEGRTDVMGTEQIPQGLAPGDIGISAEEAKELEAMEKQDGEHKGEQQAPAAYAAAPSTSAAVAGAHAPSVPSRQKHFVPPPLAADPSTTAPASTTASLAAAPPPPEKPDFLAHTEPTHAPAVSTLVDTTPVDSTSHPAIAAQAQAPSLVATEAHAPPPYQEEKH